MRQWKQGTLYSGDLPMARVTYTEPCWECSFASADISHAVYSTFDSEASARQYAERMLNMWLVRAELREV